MVATCVDWTGRARDSGRAFVNAAICGSGGGGVGRANFAVVAGRVATAGTATAGLVGCLAGAVTIFRLDGTGGTTAASAFAAVSAAVTLALSVADVPAGGCGAVANFGGGGGLIVLSFGFGVGGSTFATTTGRGAGAGGSRRIISSV